MTEFERWWSAMQVRRPAVTWTLAGLITATFALQLVFGATDSTPALRRMGALDAGLVMAGQWWRLLSCTFLHGGPLHLAMNGLVLWGLARNIERMIGAWRFVIVYAVSGLAGGLASMARLGSGISVGASGALWGMLAVEAAIVFLPQSPIVPAARPRMRQAVITNLVINLVVSFQPHVDAAAHIGGGVAGAVLAVTGVATGVPAWAPRGPRAFSVHTPLALRAVAVILGVAYVGGLGTALITGRAWALRASPELVGVAVPELTVASVAVPVELLAARRPSEDGKAVLFGDLARDGAMVSVSAAAIAPPMPREQMDAEVTALRAALVKSATAAGLETVGEVVVTPLSDGVLVSHRARAKGGVFVDVALWIASGGWVRAEVLVAPDLGDVWVGVAARIASSARWR